MNSDGFLVDRLLDTPRDPSSKEEEDKWRIGDNLIFTLQTTSAFFKELTGHPLPPDDRQFKTPGFGSNEETKETLNGETEPAPGMSSIPVRSFMDIPNMHHSQRLLLRATALQALELPARVVVVIDPRLYLPAKFFVDDQGNGQRMRQ